MLTPTRPGHVAGLDAVCLPAPRGGGGGSAGAQLPDAQPWAAGAVRADDFDLELPASGSPRARVTVLMQERSRGPERWGDPLRPSSKGMVGLDEDSGIPGHRQRLGWVCAKLERHGPGCLLTDSAPVWSGPVGSRRLWLSHSLIWGGSRAPRPHPRPPLLAVLPGPELPQGSDHRLSPPELLIPGPPKTQPQSHQTEPPTAPH